MRRRYPGRTRPAPGRSPKRAGSSFPMRRMVSRKSSRFACARGRAGEVRPVAAGAAGVRPRRPGPARAPRSRRRLPRQNRFLISYTVVATSSPGSARSTNPTPSGRRATMPSPVGASFSIRTIRRVPGPTHEPRLTGGTGRQVEPLAHRPPGQRPASSSRRSPASMRVAGPREQARDLGVEGRALGSGNASSSSLREPAVEPRERGLDLLGGLARALEPARATRRRGCERRGEVGPALPAARRGRSREGVAGPPPRPARRRAGRRLPCPARPPRGAPRPRAPRRGSTRAS